MTCKSALSLILSLFAALASFVLHAQNNPYGIDDECYEYVKQAEASLGTDEFEDANSRLLRTAVSKGDRKAQVLYYVERMRDVCRREDSEASQVLAAQEDLKQIAIKLEYKQYFYQSYQFAKNWFFNHGHHMRSLEIVQDMMKEAVDRGDEYGKWAASKEMASIYETFGDRPTARRHLHELINAYEMSEDPTIRRQSLSPYYLEYAETFYPGDDSLRFYVQQAWSCAKVPLDSVRCWQKFAKLAALEGDRAHYVYWRDLCLEPSRSRAVSMYIPALFAAVDTLFSGRPLDCRALTWKLPSPQLFWVAKIAESLGRHDASEKLKDLCIIAKDKDFGEVYNMNIAEMSTRYGNDVLSADLAKKTRQAQIAIRAMAIMLAFIIAAIVAAAVVWKKKKDRSI